MRRFCTILISCFFSMLTFAQVTAVIDNQHNATTTIEALTETAATGLKQFFETPFIENISKVQTFFKEASQLVSKIVQNLRMTRQLIETEKEIYELFVRSLDQIDKAEDFAHQLTSLFKESLHFGNLFNERTFKKLLESCSCSFRQCLDFGSSIMIGVNNSSHLAHCGK